MKLQLKKNVTIFFITIIYQSIFMIIDGFNNVIGTSVMHSTSVEHVLNIVVLI